jgi:molecular chaperone GrpE
MSRRHKHDKHRNDPADQPHSVPKTGVVDDEEQTSEPVGEPQSDAAPAAKDLVADEVADLRREVAEWRDKYLRALADQQNALRRSANERDDAIRYANAGLLRAVLDAVDDFDRAIEAAEQAESAGIVVEGMRIVQEKLRKFLRDHHVEPIEAELTPFDPAMHEALMQQPSREHAPGTVIQQVRRGYRLHDRVLRPAKVIVAAAPPEGEQGTKPEETENDADV